MNGQHLDTDLSACEARRPLRDLMLSLPHLNVRLEYNLDYESAEPAFRTKRRNKQVLRMSCAPR